MSIPIKDNAHILSNQQAFQGAYARACQIFKQIDGVVGVGFGQKETDGQYQDDIAIVVFVREKKKEGDLAPEQRIPPVFEGYRTDVRIVRRAGFQTCDNDAAYESIQGGIQIMPPRNPATPNTLTGGTLGCIVRKRNNRGRENVYLLTNKHVLFKAWTHAGDYVYHPFSPGPGIGDSNVLGPIQPQPFYGNVPFTAPDPEHPGEFRVDNFFIDCAIARIDLDSKCCGSTCTKDSTHYDAESIIDLQILGVNTIKDVRSVIYDSSIINQKVFKVGRTTGRTVGIVRLINAPIDVPRDEAISGSTHFTAENTIQIDFDTSTPNGTNNGVNCKGHARFTEHGDSGAVVLDEQGRVIGLFAMGDLPDSPSTSPSHACHILPVLDSLNICIPCTTGTSHGSSRATDGSGVAPAALSPAQSTLLAGQIVFTAQQVEGEPTTSSPNLTELVRVTDDETRHMRQLLNTFRSIRKGRELHDLFAEVRREVGYLVRNSRPVKVIWHRNKGPAFLAHVLNHLKGETDHVPHEVDGVSAVTLLTRMGEVLSKYGSNPLRRAIEQHGADFMEMITSGNCTSVQDCITYLKQGEST